MEIFRILKQKIKKIIFSESFIKFRKLTDTYYSTSDYSDYFAIEELFNNNFLKKFYNCKWS